MKMGEEVKKFFINKLEKDLKEAIEAIEQHDENDLVGLLQLTECSIEEFAKYFPTCPIEEQLAVVSILKKNKEVYFKCGSYLVRWEKENDKTKEFIIGKAYEILMNQ